MRCLCSVIIMFFLIASSNPVKAQLYEYKDSDGTMRYTDDLGMVPEHQRETAERIQSTPRASSPPDAQEAHPETDEAGSPSNEKSDGESDAKRKALLQEQAELQDEYESIQKALADIDDPPGEDASPEAFEQYNRKVEEINRRIEEYQKKLADHERRVEEYNAQQNK